MQVILKCIFVPLAVLLGSLLRVSMCGLGHYVVLIIIIIIIIIIQEISIAHNPELKAGAQCAHKRQTKHTITTTHWTIVQSYNQQQLERWTALRLLTVQVYTNMLLSKHIDY